MRLTQLTIKSWTQCCHHNDTFWSDWIVHSIQGFNAINPYLLQTISLKEFKLVDLLWFASCLPVFLLSILISIEHKQLFAIFSVWSLLLEFLRVSAQYSNLNMPLLSNFSIQISALEIFNLYFFQYFFQYFCWVFQAQSVAPVNSFSQDLCSWKLQTLSSTKVGKQYFLPFYPPSKIFYFQYLK